MNASDEKGLKQSARREKEARKQAADDFRWLSSDKRGRRFLWQFMARCQVFSPVFNTHGGLMNFNEGRRDCGLFLLGEINRLCPEQYAVMAAENAPQPEKEESDD